MAHRQRCVIFTGFSAIAATRSGAETRFDRIFLSMFQSREDIVDGIIDMAVKSTQGDVVRQMEAIVENGLPKKDAGLRTTMRFGAMIALRQIFLFVIFIHERNDAFQGIIDTAVKLGRGG